MAQSPAAIIYDSTGTNPVAVLLDGVYRLAVTGVQSPAEEATYTAVAENVALDNNKSLLGLFNPAASGYIIKLREIYLRNSRTSPVTGVAGTFEIHALRGTANLTGGTDITPVAHDSNDALPTGLICKTNGTVAGEVTQPLDLMRMSTDEWGPGTLDTESNQQSIANFMPARVKRDQTLKPFTAREGEGLHMKFATNSTAGNFDVLFVFTKV